MIKVHRHNPTVFIFFGYVPLLESVYKSIFFPASARAPTVLNIMFERKKKVPHHPKGKEERVQNVKTHTHFLRRMA